MNKIRVIKKSERAQMFSPVDPGKSSLKPRQRALVEVVGDWVTDWRRQKQIETSRALDECAQFRMGPSLGA